MTVAGSCCAKAGTLHKSTATTNTSQIGQYNVPVVLVIKKNSSTLKNLLEWLKEHSVHQGTQMVSQPMLLVDLCAWVSLALTVISALHYAAYITGFAGSRTTTDPAGPSA